MTDLYEYALPKSPNKGGAPAGYLSIRRPKKLTWKYRHGVAQYQRPLNPRKILEHQLLPLSPHDEYNVSMAKAELVDLILDGFVRRAEAFVPAASGPEFEIDWDPKKDIYFAFRKGRERDPKAKPYKDLETLADELWRYVDPKLKAKLIKEVLPKF